MQKDNLGKKKKFYMHFVGLDQWFSKWSTSTPRGQLDHPRGW